jgi:hypothetical protein
MKVVLNEEMTREDFMRDIDQQRRGEIYPHPIDCNSDCKKKGS